MVRILQQLSAVLVPGAGGEAGIGAIKSLKLAHFKGEIIATDANPLSAGLFLASSSVVMPKSSDEKQFLEKLFDIIRKKKIQVLMPTSQTDGYVYSKHRSEIEELGAIPVISEVESMDTCIDKKLTFSKLSQKFPLPFTTTDPDKIHAFPAIAKPRFGKGSRDIFLVENESDLKYVLSKVGKKEMIFQEYLPGKEYTVDVLSDLEKNPLMAVPRVRLETRGGISSKGKVVHDEDLQMECMKIASTVGISGPCCIQMKESKDGGLKLVEINPRLGGGSYLATLAGANFPAMVIDIALGKPVLVPSFSEITVVRYFEEIIVKNR